MRKRHEKSGGFFLTDTVHGGQVRTLARAGNCSTGDHWAPGRGGALKALFSCHLDHHFLHQLPWFPALERLDFKMTTFGYLSLLCREWLRLPWPLTISCVHVTYSVSKKNPPPWGLVAIFPKRLEIFQPNFSSLFCVPIYDRIRI